MAVSFTMYDWEVLKSLELQFVQLNELNQITSIATYRGRNGNCALLLTESGKVFAIGKSSGGCLGLGGVTETAGPVELEELSGVAGVCVCGSLGDALAYTSEGKVYVWGNNNVSWKRPQLVPELTDVVDARCNIGHYLALTKSGKFLTMENNLKPEDTEQECCKVVIKEEVFFELIEEQDCIDGIEEESGVINIIKEEKGCLAEKHDQSFASHILKEENISVNQIKKEDLNTIDVNKYEEFIKEEEEFDYIWPEDALKETDPLALPEIKCENEFPNTKEASVSLCESSSRKGFMKKPLPSGRQR